MEQESVFKIERVKKRKNFLLATHNGRKFVTSSMVLQVVPNGMSDSVRVGFTTSKKLGGAVARNRARRRLKEAVRFVLPSKAVSGFDYVVIGRHAAIDRPFEKLQGDLSYALKQFKKSLEEKPISDCK